MIDKPADIVGRNDEWSSLVGFAESIAPRGGVGLLYGRRRTGKSFLLRRLVEAAGGLYFQATESERSDALAEFAHAVVEWRERTAGKDAEPIRYTDWTEALSRREGLVVIDEFPYLLRHSPEIPSVMQRIVDEASNGAHAAVRFVICDSSLSVMANLLSGQHPLRGRATLDLLLRPMEHSESAELWGVDDLEVAVRLHAIFGGARGYRALTNGAPSSVDDLGRWLRTNVLNPNHALYREDDYLLQEERTITDRALYGSLLRAIALGVSTQTELAGRLQRSRESLTHPIATLTRAGFLNKHTDTLTRNRPELRLADPIIRFIRLVVDPGRPLLEEGRWEDVWQRAQHRLDANIYGPHLEHIARRWAIRSHRPVSAGAVVTEVGSGRVPDRAGRAMIELDVVATGETSSGARAVLLLAEVKWSPNSFGAAAIERLQHARSLLARAGHDTAHCEVALISRVRSDLPGEGLRIGLHDLYAR